MCIRDSYVTSAALLAVITLDAVLSVLATIKLDKHLAKIKEIQEQLRENLEDLKEDLEDFKDDITEFKDEQNEKFREWLGEHGDAFDDMKDALEQWWSENKARRDKRNAKWEQLLSCLLYTSRITGSLYAASPRGKLLNHKLCPYLVD